MGGIETNAKSESSLLRKIRARCMDLTVNQWLGEFDSHMRSKEFSVGASYNGLIHWALNSGIMVRFHTPLPSFRILTANLKFHC